MKRISIFIFIWLPFLTMSQTYNVRDYGATGMKGDLQTAAIQSAINQAFENGGGKVYLPPGEYLSGTIVLKSNVTFFLEAGATLLASRNIDDYKIPLQHCIWPTLIYANGAKNFSIRGKGKIHGQAEREYRDLEKVDRFIVEETELAREAGVEMKMFYKVPPVNFLLLITGCQGFTLEDVSFIESSLWAMNLVNSERINIKGIYVQSSLESGVNSDGIDLNGCRDVMISNCKVITGDDAIVIKSWKGRDYDTENITVSNCILSSSSTALKIGTETYGNFSGIVFNNCVIRNSNRGLSIVVRNGGHVRDVIFSNITIECNRRHFNWWGAADPIWLVVQQPNKKLPLGSISNVVFENIIAHGRGTSKIKSMVGSEISNVTLRNVQFHMHEEDAPDKRATDCFVAENVNDLSLDQVKVVWDTVKTEPKWASALRFNQVNGLRIIGFSGRQGLLDASFPVIQMENVRNGILMGALPAEGANTLLQIGGGETHGIIMKDNDPFGKTRTDFKLNPDVIHKNSLQLQDR